jgi:hypothetical protein
VDDAVLVCTVERLCHLPCQREGLGHGQTVPLSGGSGRIAGRTSGGTVSWRRAVYMQRRCVDEVGEGQSTDQLHHERDTALRTFESVHRGNVRMVQRSQQAGFALESGEALRITREDVGKDLERNITVETGIPREVDFTHRAGTEQAANLVGAEPHRALQGHRRCRNPNAAGRANATTGWRLSPAENHRASLSGARPASRSSQWQSGDPFRHPLARRRDRRTDRC